MKEFYPVMATGSKREKKKETLLLPISLQLLRCASPTQRENFVDRIEKLINYILK
jgi:hypothetical protein